VAARGATAAGPAAVFALEALRVVGVVDGRAIAPVGMPIGMSSSSSSPSVS
jgi:hypothetical protein